MFFISFICLTYQCCGQINLYPCIFNSDIKKVQSYNGYLLKKIDSELDQNYLIRFIARPAFEPEYSFQIIKKSSCTYELQTLSFPINLWNTPDVDSTILNTVKLDSNLAQAIIKLFFKLTLDVSQNPIELGLDGTTYNFLYSLDGEIKCAEVWSPKENSVLHKIVDVCEDVVEKSEDRDSSYFELFDRITEINRKLP